MPKCSVCSSDAHSRVDSMIAAGTAQAVISKVSGFSQSAISRHASRHLGNSIGAFDINLARTNIRDEELLSTLVNLLADVRAIQASAMAGNRGSLALQSAGSARELIKIIHEISKSEGDPTELLDAVAEGSRLAAASAAVVRGNPEFGFALAAELESGDAEMAAQVRTLAERSRASLDMKRRN